MIVLSKRTFRGGVHPHEYKELSEEKPIEKAKIPEKVVLPLSQNLGAPAKALVEVGAEVKIGQKIADAGGFVSVPLHAPISGKVTSIGNFLHPNGHLAPCIVIEKGDGPQEMELKEVKGWEKLAKDKVLDAVKEAGLVGFGGATFPTHVKLSPPKDKPIDTIILNGAECEPFLTADHRLMLEQPEGIVEGLKILMKITGAKQGIIGIENNKMDAAKALADTIGDDKDIKVVVVKVKYPQGGEKQLIKSVLNREVPPPPGLPMDVGVVVQNVGTAVAVYEAVRYNKPFIERVVTVSGRGVKESKNLMVRIGTLMADLVDQCGGVTDDVDKIIMGGPMMGLSQFDLTVPAVKGTSGILIMRNGDTQTYEEQTCIKCGRCVQACPMKLVPNMLVKLVDNGRFEEAEQMNAMSCIECGSCSFACPAKIWLVQKIKYAKAEINARRKKAS
ncbi:MAG: electron transport complex subunit RsxC [Acidobacteria bacterium]|nr:electron transport complex subunit RsxC [Acidobacteriota bacterium]